LRLAKALGTTPDFWLNSQPRRCRSLPVAAGQRDPAVGTLDDV